MEYLVPPVILLHLLRFGFHTLITWFFERFVEPQSKPATQSKRLAIESVTEKSNAQKIAATRQELAELKQRLDRKAGG